MAIPMKYLGGLGTLAFIVCAIGLFGCTETVRTLENDSFKVTVTRLNVAAFEEFTLNVYVNAINGLWSPRTKLLELEGLGDIEVEFADSNLLLLKSGSPDDYPIYLIHYLMRIPMKCIGTIAYDVDSPDDPFTSGTIPYETKSLGWRIVSFHKTRLSEKVIMVMFETDRSKYLYPRSVLIAPVDAIAGELINVDTLRLSITWCGDNRPQEVLVKMPTSKEKDLEYIIKQ